VLTQMLRPGSHQIGPDEPCIEPVSGWPQHSRRFVLGLSAEAWPERGLGRYGECLVSVKVNG
jgi:hypothetical protein